MKTTFWNNKNIVITGGTSGLGKALAHQLHEAGANVVIIARNKQPLDQMVEMHPGLIGLQGDISSKHQIYPLAGQIQSSLDGIDVLFNVASDLGPTPLKLLLDTECEDFENALQTNLLGPFRLTKALIAPMLLQRQGIVVNISSDAAVSAYPRWGIYSVSKAALDHLTRIFDAELKDQGLNFVAIDPGDMNTPMHFAAIPDADPQKLRRPEDSAERILQLLMEQNFSQVRRSL